MISLTEEARKELEAYFEGKEKTPIRVYSISMFVMLTWLF